MTKTVGKTKTSYIYFSMCILFATTAIAAG